MPPKKGSKSNNPAGRPKGSKNKITLPLKESITLFLENSWEDVQDDFKKLDPFQRIQAFERLLGYAIPKLRSIDATLEVEKKLEALTDRELSELINLILEKE